MEGMEVEKGEPNGENENPIQQDTLDLASQADEQSPDESDDEHPIMSGLEAFLWVCSEIRAVFLWALFAPIGFIRGLYLFFFGEERIKGGAMTILSIISAVIIWNVALSDLSPNVVRVRDGYYMNPLMTVGDCFDRYFTDMKWSSSGNTVTFNGVTSNEEDDHIPVSFVFTLDYGDDSFEITRGYYEGQSLNEIELYVLAANFLSL